MEIPDNKPLPPHYYRDNFLRLCDTVRARYGDLLLEEEQLFLDEFTGLPFDAQCLYIRLASRVGPWFRESKLHYPELGQLDRAVQQLLADSFAVEAAALCTDDLGRLFTRGELGRLFHEPLAGRTSQRKQELLDAVDALDFDEAQLAQCAREAETGRIIAPLATDIVQRLQVLFFGNRYQSLTDFVLEDLGLTRYFPYALGKDERLFTCRGALEEYLYCADLADQYYEFSETGDGTALAGLAADLLALDINYPSSEKRWHRLLNSLARDLERNDESGLAMALYARSRRHPARERAARILEKKADWHGAQSLCRDILETPWCEAEQEAAQRILPRVQRKLGAAAQSRRRDKFDECHLQLIPGDRAVELLVADHLAPQWSAVYYVENSLMNSLFGLAFWEQIFAPVPGAFHNAYQSVPGDMYEREFYQRRRQSIDARRAELAAGDLAAQLRSAYRRYGGFQCRWLDWRYLDEALLEHALAVIPGEHLLAIWQRMLFDPRENRRGFPDLIALGEERGDYRMIEVKGPGDALQDSQKRWLRFFQGADIPAQVAWVAWRDA